MNITSAKMHSANRQIGAFPLQHYLQKPGTPRPQNARRSGTCTLRSPIKQMAMSRGVGKPSRPIFRQTHAVEKNFGKRKTATCPISGHSPTGVQICREIGLKRPLITSLGLGAGNGVSVLVYLPFPDLSCLGRGGWGGGETPSVCGQYGSVFPTSQPRDWGGWHLLSPMPDSPLLECLPSICAMGSLDFRSPSAQGKDPHPPQPGKAALVLWQFEDAS